MFLSKRKIRGFLESARQNDRIEDKRIEGKKTLATLEEISQKDT